MYEKKRNYTEEEKRTAMGVSLTQLARSMGYTPVRCGINKYKLKEMDSLIIYNDVSYYRWSERKGGSQIDFLMQFGNCRTVPEAVHALLDFCGYSGRSGQPLMAGNIARKQETPAGEKKTFVLPEKAESFKRIYAYLLKERKLSKKVVDYMVRKNLLYEDKAHHNCVFVGRDPSGVARYAALRGTADIYGKKFKGDVPGNDKHYGVCLVNKDSEELNVFESTIDMMSYIDITNDYDSNKLVLGMLSDHPLEQFLKDYDHIKKISFRLDNDEPAKRAVFGEKYQSGDKTGGLLEKYSKTYEVMALLAPDLEGIKDYNEYLKYIRNCIQGQSVSVDKEQKNIELQKEKRKMVCRR